MEGDIMGYAFAVAFASVVAGVLIGALSVRSGKNRQISKIRAENAEHMLHSICMPWFRKDDKGKVIAVLDSGALSNVSGGVVKVIEVQRHVVLSLDDKKILREGKVVATITMIEEKQE